MTQNHHHPSQKQAYKKKEVLIPVIHLKVSQDTETCDNQSRRQHCHVAFLLLMRMSQMIRY